MGMGLEARGCRWGRHDGSQGPAGLRLSSCLLEAQFSWGSLNMEALVRGSGVGAGEPRVCVSHSVPGDVDTAGEGATVWRRGAHTEGRWGAELLPTPNCPTPLMPRRPRCGTGVKACMSRLPLRLRRPQVASLLVSPRWSSSSTGVPISGGAWTGVGTGLQGAQGQPTAPVGLVLLGLGEEGGCEYLSCLHSIAGDSGLFVALKASFTRLGCILSKIAI